VEETRRSRSRGSDINWGLNIPGPKWAAVEGEKTFIVGGFAPQRAGVYTTWFLASKEAWATQAKRVTEIAIERKNLMFSDGSTHRLETVCLASRKLAHRWYKTIGLAHEATLKGYCIDGSDAMVFADVRGKP